MSNELVGSTWAIYTLLGRGFASSTSTTRSAATWHLLSRLKEQADAAEAAPFPAALQVNLGSPALHKAVGAQDVRPSRNGGVEPP